MKLYTEEQLREAIELAREKYQSDMMLSTNGIMLQFTPIQLPSDDEILYESQGVFVNRIDLYEEGFIDGAEWVVNKIKGGEQ